MVEKYITSGNILNILLNREKNSPLRSCVYNKTYARYMCILNTHQKN